MIYTVCAGHSDADPGNLGGGRREAVLMVELRDLVASRLRALGHTVRTDGEHGLNWPLTRAVTLIAGADLAVELHTNAAGAPGARGVEVIALPARQRESQAIAAAIAGVLQIPLRRVAGWFPAETHRLERGWYRPAAFARHGGLIVETFFQSNPHELAAYLVQREALADAIAGAMIAT